MDDKRGKYEPIRSVVSTGTGAGLVERGTTGRIGGYWHETRSSLYQERFADRFRGW